LGKIAGRISQVIADPTLYPTYRRLRRERLGFHEFDRYNLRRLKQRGISTILDIGANRGQFFLVMKQHFPNARVYCFEPLAEPFGELKSRVGQYAGSAAFNCALGTVNGNITFYRNEFSAASSPLPMSSENKRLIADIGLHPEALQETPIEVRCARLDDVCAAEQIEVGPNTLIKLDVQGYEDEVIRGGGATFGKAGMVVTEVSFFEAYDGQVLFDGVYALLRDLGFAFHGFIDEQRSPVDDALWQADALFIRD
jgi:FkbM family methyltransferase